MADRRPQRHRRNVTHYSDDNPSTFTIKRKRGEPPPPPPTDSAAKRRAARAEGRRQRELRQLPQLPHNHASSNGASTTKRGPGRPPTSNNNNKHPNASRKRVRPSKNPSSDSTFASSQLKPLSPVIPPPQDEILSHTVSIQPVLPLNVPERRSLQQRYPQLYQENYVGSLTPPPTSAASSAAASSSLEDSWIRITEAHKERWVPLLQSNPNGSTALKGDNHTSSSHNHHDEESSLIALPAAPWTCFAVRQDDPLYFCVGDAAGNILLYSSQPKSVCIQTVQTRAAKREAERPILWSQSKTALTANSHNSIGACAWRGNVCVAWTRQEVEILDVVEHSTLLVLALDQLPHPSSALLPSNGSHVQTLSNINHNNTATSASGAAGQTQNSVGSSSNNNNSHNPKRRQQTFSYQSLDLHPTRPLLLWRPLGCRLATDGKDEDAAAAVGASLWCIDFSNSQVGAKRKVLIPPPGAASAKDVFCHAAVWDVYSQLDEILTVQSHPQSLEGGGGENGSTSSSSLNNSHSVIASLCRVRVDTGETTQRTTLPESGSVSGRLSTIYTDCVLEQYEDYLFLCTGRGIRCYERNRLTFLTVYGETVALHGTTVGWQACFWIPEPSFDPSELAVSTSGTGFKYKQTCWIQRSDELQRRDLAEQHQEQHRQFRLLQQKESLSRQESSSSTQSNGHHGVHTGENGGLSGSFTSHSSNGSGSTKHRANKLFSNMLLVGVPHPTRGPEELQSTLYVWKPGQVLPLTTLQAPRGGLLGLHIHATPTTGWRLTCATAKHGQGWQLYATLKSDFAGTMYPVGYQLLTDNVEYLEEEGELDQVLVLPQHPHLNDESPHRSSEESDLQKALKRSLEMAGEDRISVLLDVVEMELEENRVLVPCVPDPSLREVFEEGDSSALGGRSPGRRFRSAPQTLSLFPQFKSAKEQATEQEEEHSKRQKQPAPPPLTIPSLSSAALTEQPCELASSGGAALPAAASAALKAKGKRSRATNIEAMLQSSIDVSLKHKMDLLHKEWNSGGSRFKHGPVEDDDHNVGRDQEDSIPFLLPSSASEAAKQSSTLSSPPHPLKPTPVNVPADFGVEVTPSEPSPATTVDGNDGKKEPFCAACCDRMVIHTCGKRELPVDTEALERAEQARKEAEEAEAKRVRAEKRRVAEAKRRETRRKKKEEEDRRRYMERLEEERRLREEEERKAQFALLHPEQQRVTLDLVDYSQQQQVKEEPVQAAAAAARPAIPKFSELRTNGYTTSSSGTSTAAPHGFYSSTSTTNSSSAAESFSVSVSAAPASSLYPESSTATAAAATATTTAAAAASASTSKWASSGTDADNSYYKTEDPASDMTSPPVSTTLSGADGDALAALVGLADSMAPKSSTPPPAQAVRHYDYSGSSDRRTAILKQLSHFKQLSGASEPRTAEEANPYYSPNARAAAGSTTTVNGGNDAVASSSVSSPWGTGTGNPDNKSTGCD